MKVKRNPSMISSATIRIAAAIIRRADGMILLVRKRGTATFMQPGGKIEFGEEPVAALCRELSEELGLEVNLAEPQYLGRYSAVAAHESGHVVVADIFRIDVNECVTPAAEIEEISWVDPKKSVALVVAPLTRDHVFRLVRTDADGGARDQQPLP